MVNSDDFFFSFIQKGRVSLLVYVKILFYLSHNIYSLQMYAMGCKVFECRKDRNQYKFFSSWIYGSHDKHITCRDGALLANSLYVLLKSIVDIQFFVLYSYWCKMYNVFVWLEFWNEIAYSSTTHIAIKEKIELNHNLKMLLGQS